MCNKRLAKRNACVVSEGREAILEHCDFIEEIKEAELSQVGQAEIFAGFG